MSDRRGFLKSLFTAPVAVAAWATVAKAEAPKKLSRPNCLLAEQDEMWTLAKGTRLPVRRIEVQLDFQPAVTWEIREDGRVIRRVVIPRLTERELRVSSALRKAGHSPLYSNRQLVPLTGMTLDDLDAERDTIIDSKGDTETPLADLLRERMSDCYDAWAQQAPKWIPEPDKGHHKDGFVHEARGAFVVIDAPEGKQFGIGVTQYEITSSAMLIQAPAQVLFA
jgi:hypothetical protein